jgi:hypothetical protein
MVVKMQTVGSLAGDWESARKDIEVSIGAYLCLEGGGVELGPALLVPLLPSDEADMDQGSQQSGWALAKGLLHTWYRSAGTIWWPQKASYMPTTFSTGSCHTQRPEKNQGQSACDGFRRGRECRRDT